MTDALAPTPAEIISERRRDKRIECDNCDWKGLQSDAAEAEDIWQRVDPGAEFPAGECPKCGALAYIVEEENIYVQAVRKSRHLISDAAEALRGLLAQLEGPVMVHGDGIGNDGTKTGLSGEEFDALCKSRVAKARAVLTQLSD